MCNSQSPDALCGINDLLENSLDVEWSAAIAKNAQIVLVASYPASATDDNLYDSESYIVDHLTARIMNVSYGECELGNGTAGNVEYYDLWQTASSEGIAVFVAAGDSGAASCDDGSDSFYGVPWSAQLGTNVSGLASTPYNTAVGGTDFNWCSLTSTSECTRGSLLEFQQLHAQPIKRTRLRSRGSVERHMYQSAGSRIFGELLSGQRLHC